MKSVLLVLSFILAICLGSSVSGYAATYYVDWDEGTDQASCCSSPGPGASACKTPWYADDCPGLGGGDTVIVYAKNDNTAYTNGDNSYVLEINGSTWQAAAGETPRLSAGDSWGDNPSFQGAAGTVVIGSNSVLDGFKIWGMVFIGGDNNTVRNCDIEGGGNATGNDNFPCVLYIHGAMDGSNDSSNNLIQNNKLHDNIASVSYGFGDDNSPLVMTYYEEGTIFENNDIYNSVGPGIFNKSAPDDIIIRHNFFHDNVGPAIRGSEGNMQHGGDQTYYQNIFLNDHIAPYQASPHQYYIYNNIFFNTDTINKWTTYDNIHFFNNICYISSSKRAVHTEAAFTLTMFDYLDYNTYYKTAGNYGWEFNYSSVASSLSSWRTFLISRGEGANTRETNSLTSNPNFLNGSGNFTTPTDFKRNSYPTDGRSGSWPSIRGAYITGNEIIGSTNGQAPITPPAIPSNLKLLRTN